MDRVGLVDALSELWGQSAGATRHGIDPKSWKGCWGCTLAVYSSTIHCQLYTIHSKLLYIDDHGATNPLRPGAPQAHNPVTGKKSGQCGLNDISATIVKSQMIP